MVALPTKRSKAQAKADLEIVAKIEIVLARMEKKLKDWIERADKRKS